jgi:hypothetical protein
MRTTNIIATILIWLGFILSIFVENTLGDALIIGFQLGVLALQIAYNIFD